MSAMIRGAVTKLTAEADATLWLGGIIIKLFRSRRRAPRVIGLFRDNVYRTRDIATSPAQITANSGEPG